MRLASRPAKLQPAEDDKQAEHLPDEIVLEILSHIPHTKESQSDLWSFCLVKRQWYNVAISRLYEEPWLEGSNFDPFVNTICPSRNLHIKNSELAGLVRVLDLKRIVHQSTKATTARLLGRTKSNLEVFIAPQSAFAINSFAALSKCTNLRVLDFSLICEAVSFSSLAHVLAKLPNLKTLYFPRSSSDSASFDASTIAWPPLERLYLSGSIDSNFIRRLLKDDSLSCRLPASLKTLSITHCPRLATHDLTSLIRAVGPQLEVLTVENIRGLRANAMDRVLDFCPHLKLLRVSLDYLTFMFVYRDQEDVRFLDHPLERLELTDSGNMGWSLDPDEVLKAGDLADAIQDGTIPNLRIIRVSKSALWHVDDADEMRRLIDTMEETFSKRKAENPDLDNKVVGVWTMED
ncbi:F-box protein [Lasiodiplodia theobromae]|uniref:F-box protein n=1 Tax=Lasiodiplodia theobromae TaxID=45133 RepID=A0A5N5DRD2_9PEZI|nr:F-box protein [Lasiodiplodia theobromae]